MGDHRRHMVAGGVVVRGIVSRITALAIRDRLERQVELVIDGGACSLQPTTVIDLTGDEPLLLRQGRGDAAPFGL